MHRHVLWKEAALPAAGGGVGVAATPRAAAVCSSPAGCLKGWELLPAPFVFGTRCWNAAPGAWAAMQPLQRVHCCSRQYLEKRAQQWVELGLLASPAGAGAKSLSACSMRWGQPIHAHCRIARAAGSLACLRAASPQWRRQFVLEGLRSCCRGMGLHDADCSINLQRQVICVCGQMHSRGRPLDMLGQLDLGERAPC